MKRILILVALLLAAPQLFARSKTQGFCEDGNKTVTTSSIVSTTKVQQSLVPCNVTVYLSGTGTPALVYSDNSGTPKANPFCTATDGQWFFYADDGRYDVQFSSGSVPVCGIVGPTFTTFTRGDFQSIDSITCAPAVSGSDFGSRVSAAIASMVGTNSVIDCSNAGSANWTTPIVMMNGKSFQLKMPAGSLAASYAGNLITWANSGQLVMAGAGRDLTILNLSGGSKLNWTPGYPTAGMGFHDLTINQASSSDNTVIIGDGTSVNGPVQFDSTNVTLNGSGANGGGASKGFDIESMHTSYFIGTFVNSFPGAGIYINGDASGELHFTTTYLDSNTLTLDIELTSDPNLGGMYFTDFVSTNLHATVGGGVRINSTVPNVSFSFLGSGFVIDNATGEDNFYYSSLNHLILSHSWFTNGSAAGANCTLIGGTNCWAAIRVINVADVTITGTFISGFSRDVSLEQGVSGFYASDNRLVGDTTDTVGYYIDTAAGKNNSTVGSTWTTVGAPLLVLTNDYITWVDMGSTNKTPVPALQVGTREFSCPDAFSLLDVEPGATGDVNKYFRIVGGTLQILTTGCTPILQVSASGQTFFHGNLQMDTSGVPFNIQLFNGLFEVRNTANTESMLEVSDNGLSDNAAGFKQVRSNAICTTGAAVGATCTSGAITWTTAFADANYTLTCTIDTVTGGVPVIVATTKTAGTSFTITIAALTAIAASGGYNCVGIHSL